MTRTRKQREIASREGLILDAARRLLLEDGYDAVTMDRIAKAIEYSKGTVYQHFRSREDIVVALAAQTKEERIGLFERAALFSGRPRERMVAIGVADRLFVNLYPQHAATEQLTHAASIQDKAAQERLRAMYSCDLRCYQAMVGVIRDGIAAGDLTLADGHPPDELAFGLMSLAFGSQFLGATALHADIFRIDDPDAALWVNLMALLDGHGWRPLSSEHDYDDTIRRVMAEVFSAEAASADLTSRRA